MEDVGGGLYVICGGLGGLGGLRVGEVWEGRLVGRLAENPSYILVW